MKVLVTGGSGFLGKALQKVRPDWIYLSSKDVDLRCEFMTMKKLTEINPDAIVHLAGRVGGIKENSLKQADFYHDNIMMNTNIIHCAQVLGIKRVLSSLSTCAFPDVVEKYPFTEKDILNGPPAKTNLSYGFTKRSLYVMTNAYRSQFGLNYSTFCPSNLYGSGDDFDLQSSHFVSAMIRKFHEAKENGSLEFWGTGKPLRQQLYVEDLAFFIPTLLEHHNDNEPIIVAPDENLSIETMIKICQKIFRDKYNKDIDYKFNGVLDGQYNKQGSNKLFMELIHQHLKTRELISFEVGLEKTIKWYEENK